MSAKATSAQAKNDTVAPCRDGSPTRPVTDMSARAEAGMSAKATSAQAKNDTVAPCRDGSPTRPGTDPSRPRRAIPAAPRQPVFSSTSR